MLVKEVSFNSFRNLKEYKFVPIDGMNVICGENAQGKTNLIEAIWLFTGAKSFRGNKDNELVKFGETCAKLNMDFIAEGVKKEAEIIIEQRRRAVLNGNRYNQAASLAGSFCAIVFSPDDLGLITEGPAKRRRFLDIAITELHPSYLNALRKYNRAVTQRNALLKENKKGYCDLSLLNLFEEEIATNGSIIIKERLNYLEEIKDTVSGIYRGLSAEKENLSVEYISTVGEDFLNQLKLSRKEDFLTATTSVGPHRDDLSFFINNQSVRNFGSQGQKRSAALAMKLSEAEILKRITGEFPVALLDDVMSELDPERQNYILNHIDGWQVFLTCCDPSNTKNLNKGKIFWVKNGEISED